MAWSTTPVILIFLTSLAMTSGSLDDVTVRTTHGDVRGQTRTVLERQVTVYWGIPYGKIPARFQRPESAESWKGVLDATTPPPSCPEVPYILDILLIPETSTPFDEDCLYLNLWVPKGCVDQADAEGLAVMVWIHGGGLEFGSSTVPTYNGQVLAATQCVIVASMNYRLGALGFASLGTASAPGNAGLLDQALALQWIHSNAGSFGGSARRITLFGESAGGLSVGALMASPLSRDLFSRAILQSGATGIDMWDRTVARSAADTRKLAAMVGCPADDGDDDRLIKCLSEKDSVEMGKVVADQKRLHFDIPAFGVVVDNHFIHKPLTEHFQDKDVKQAEVMMGFTRDEGSFLIPVLTGMYKMGESSRPAMKRETFRQLLKGFFKSAVPDPSKHENIISALEYVYLNSSLSERREDYHAALEKFLGDFVFICSVYKTAASVLGANDVYVYSFEHRSSVSPFPEWMGVVHASELDFVFGRPLDQGPSFTEEEKQLSRLMMTAWANFAKFGNPNSADVPTRWPPLNNATYPYAILRSPDDIAIEHGRRYRECVFTNELLTALITELNDLPGKQGHDEL